jgi:DNA helicase-2/ATP-dependent DNA helicase PcrA
MQLSNYQLAIDDAILNGRGNIVVNAVAGAGKSTQIRRNVNMVSGRRVLVAFNAHIAKANQEFIKDPAVESRTMHSLGMSAVSAHVKPARVNVQEHKYADLAKGFFDERKDQTTFSRLLDLVRVSLVDGRNIDAIMDLVIYHNLEAVTQAMIDAVAPVLAMGVKQGERGLIDFTDMIWLPNVLNLRPVQFDWVFCDELQDLNPAQAGLVAKLLAKGGRFVGVGDPRQSIYGFAGADANSFYALKERFNAVELPLSITYRCPKAVVKLAQRIVPHLEAREDAPEGLVGSVKESQLPDFVAEGDLVLCRLTAPLIQTCIAMITRKIPARVRGRDIAKSLTTIVQKVAKVQYDKEFSLDGLSAWYMSELTKLEKRDHNEASITAHQDKYDGIKAIYQAYADGPDYNTTDFCADIDSLFSDGRASVILSTVHKAKGLENQRVFILKPSKLPFFMKNMTEWQGAQEVNLEYVAYTRAIGELYMVEEDMDK